MGSVGPYGLSGLHGEKGDVGDTGFEGTPGINICHWWCSMWYQYKFKFCIKW